MIAIQLRTTNHVPVVEEKPILHTEAEEENPVQHGTNFADFETKEDTFREFVKLLLKNIMMNLMLLKRKMMLN